MSASTRDFASGLTGGVGCTCCGLPFDGAKVALQNHPGKYNGFLDAMAQRIRAAGPIGLYRGFFPALASAVSENMVAVPVQRGIRRLVSQLHGLPADHRHSFGAEIAIGGATGIFTSTTITPFETLKVQQQVHGGSWLGGARAVLASDGVSGLFRGLTATMSRDVPFNALFFGSYETYCTLCMQYEGVSAREDLSTLCIFCCGGLAGCTGWTPIIPFDVVKTRLQAGSARGSVPSVMGSIARTEGWRALFTGWTVAVVRAFPANAGLFVGVETAVKVMNHWLGRIEVERPS